MPNGPFTHGRSCWRDHFWIYVVLLSKCSFWCWQCRFRLDSYSIWHRRVKNVVLRCFRKSKTSWNDIESELLWFNIDWFSFHDRLLWLVLVLILNTSFRDWINFFPVPFPRVYETHSEPTPLAAARFEINCAISFVFFSLQLLNDIQSICKRTFREWNEIKSTWKRSSVCTFYLEPRPKRSNQHWIKIISTLKRSNREWPETESRIFAVTWPGVYVVGT